MPAPNEISGLFVWLRADDLDAAFDDEDAINSNWADASGLGHDAAPNNGPVFKEAAINTHDAVEFTAASSQYFQIADDTDIKLHQSSTVFLVLKATAAAASAWVSKAPNGVGAGAFYLYAPDSGLEPTLDRPWVEAGTEATGGIGTTDYKIVTCRVNGTAVEHRLNGAANGSDTLANGTSTTDPLWIGRYTAQYGSFLLAEVVIYNVALSDGDRDAVEEYLNEKYFTPPTNRKGRVYQVYAEIPAVERTGRVFQVFARIPSVPRTGRIYQVLAEFPSFARVGRVFQVFGRIPSPPSGSGGPGGGSPGEEIVTDFNRLLAPVHSTGYERPRGKQSWGLSGKVQARAGFSAGMRWTETYQPRRLNDPEFWGFLEYLNELQQNERLFEISLPDIMGRPTLLGTATGSMAVNGADQVGFTLSADGWSGTLKAGDLLRIAGLNYTMVVVEDVSATSDITISPGILSGGSPDDNAEIAYGSSLTVRAKIDRIVQPEVDGDQVYVGLRVTFREAP